MKVRITRQKEGKELDKIFENFAKIHNLSKRAVKENYYRPTRELKQLNRKKPKLLECKLEELKEKDEWLIKIFNKKKVFVALFPLKFINFLV